MKENKNRYHLSKDELIKVCAHALDSDYRTVRATMLTVMILEFVMVFTSLANPPRDWVHQIHQYLYFYLAFGSLICFILVTYEKKHQKYLAFYFTVLLHTVICVTWGAGISFCDCHVGTDLSAYAYAMIGSLAVYCMIEPIHAFIISTVSASALMYALYATNASGFGRGRIIQIISIYVLTIFGTVITFNMKYRRIVAELDNEEKIIEIDSLLRKIDNERAILREEALKQADGKYDASKWQDGTSLEAPPQSSENRMAIDDIYSMYSFIAKVNLMDDSFKEINVKEGKSGRDGQFYAGFIKFIGEGRIHPADVNEAITKSDPGYLKNEFLDGAKSVDITFRRKENGTYIMSVLEIIPASGFCLEKQDVYVYAKRLYCRIDGKN